jgi:hypothetical protein
MHTFFCMGGPGNLTQNPAVAGAMLYQLSQTGQDVIRNTE